MQLQTGPIDPTLSQGVGKKVRSLSLPINYSRGSLEYLGWQMFVLCVAVVSEARGISQWIVNDVRSGVAHPMPRVQYLLSSSFCRQRRRYCNSGERQGCWLVQHDTPTNPICAV